VSWKHFVRAAAADARRQQRGRERDAVRRHRELQREAEKAKVQEAKEAEKQRAAHEVALFENYLELLVSVHKDWSDTWDWRAIAHSPPPPAPVRGNQHEAAAAAALRDYKPGFFDKILGGEKKRLDNLRSAVARGKETDDAEFAQAMQGYQQLHAHWGASTVLASRLLGGDVSAYAAALEHAGAFVELGSFKTRVTVTDAETDVVSLACEMLDDELVPKEEVKLTAAGKLSSKEMAAGRYWTLYQDHVCSCAIRAATETFAVLPISRVIVNIGGVRLNKSTGHQELVTSLAVHFQRQTLSKLNLDSIDPSDSMKNFPHRMKFKKSSGFEPVSSITTDEQWVST
jgi:hypothetical protein